MKNMKKQAVSVAVAVAMGTMAGIAMAYDDIFGSGDFDDTGIPQEMVYRDTSHGVTIDPSKATALGNKFVVKDGTWAKIYGGFTGSSDASNNTVTINGETVGVETVYGGINLLGQGDAKYNTVIWQSGDISKSLKGSVTFCKVH